MTSVNPLTTLPFTGRGMSISQSSRIEPGAYREDDATGAGVMQIRESGLVVDLSGVTLTGTQADHALYAGVGLVLVGCRDVTVRGLRVSRYRIGILAVGCDGLRIEDCDTSGSRHSHLYSTPTQYDSRDWLDVFTRDIWEQFGSGIYLRNCTNCLVRSSVASRAQNGLTLDGCSSITVLDNDFSHNSGWGIHMTQTCDSRIIANRCDYCVRCEGETYSVGGDSAGIIINDACHRNLFLRNSLTHSGDGFFLTAQYNAPSNYNTIAENDGTYSPHNAFESTFSDHNVFIANTASHSGYGFWMGYSRDNIVADNLVEDNEHIGIAIEHGQRNRILRNVIRRNGKGIMLFIRTEGAQESVGSVVEGNRLERNGAGVVLQASKATWLRANVFEENSEDLREEEGCEGTVLA